jgi:hypothetical protein
MKTFSKSYYQGAEVKTDQEKLALHIDMVRIFGETFDGKQHLAAVRRLKKLNKENYERMFWKFSN